MLPICPHALLAGALLATASVIHAQDAPVVVTVPERPSLAALANVVQDNFIGVSWELSSFDTLWGNTVDTIPSAMLNYMSNIRQRITNSMRIRVGGSGMDSSTYDPDLAPMLKLTDPDAYFNNIPVDFGPTLFDIMNAMADRVGSMQFTIGLSMQDAQNDANVVLLASAATARLGDRLDAMTLGNEPDLYDGHGNIVNYNISRYVVDLGKVIGDLHDAPGGDILNRTLLAGPTTCCDKWPLSDVINGGLNKYPYKYYTLQHYPKNACNGFNADNTNITYYLSHSQLRSYTRWDQAGVNFGKQLGVPVLLTEYNTVSCGGSNISDTFAATMWVIDAGLQFATNNFSAIYIHTREFQIQYNLFDPPSPSTPTLSGWRTGSPYYAVLLLAETFSSSGSVVVDLNLENSLTDPSATVAGYGIYDNGGASRGKLVLFNRADAGGALRTFSIPANVSSGQPIGVRLLRAPSVYERTEISWAGQTIGPTGELEGERTTEYLDCADGCDVSVPGPGVALVYLDPNATDTDSFYDGNSTVAAGGDARADSSSRVSALRCGQWFGVLLGIVGVLSLL